MINMKKFAWIGLAGMIALSSVITVFAAQANTSQSTADSKHFARGGFEQLSGNYKSALDQLVTAGTITQEQEDAVMATLPDKDKKGGQGAKGEMKQKPFDSLVSAGTITQEQADAIESAMEAARESKDSTKSSMKDVLDSLVTAGTITQEQENAITAATPGKDKKDGQGPKGEMKQKPFDSLVSAGTITQEQADAIESAMKAARESKDSTKSSMKDVLDSLVTAGTLTQEQEDAITAAMPGKDKKDGQGPKGEMKQKPLDSLVSAGTITQKQADAIESALKAVSKPANK